MDVTVLCFDMEEEGDDADAEFCNGCWWMASIPNTHELGCYYANGVDTLSGLGSGEGEINTSVLDHITSTVNPTIKVDYWPNFWITEVWETDGLYLTWTGHYLCRGQVLLCFCSFEEPADTMDCELDSFTIPQMSKELIVVSFSHFLK